MPAEIDYESDDICVLRVSGVWKRSEFAAAQKDVAERIDTGANPKLLAILENFQGWERGADWNDLDFLVSHSDKLQRSPSLQSRNGAVAPGTRVAPTGTHSGCKWELFIRSSIDSNVPS
jgi:hypothetical protein